MSITWTSRACILCSSTSDSHTLSLIVSSSIVSTIRVDGVMSLHRRTRGRLGFTDFVCEKLGISANCFFNTATHSREGSTVQSQTSTTTEANRAAPNYSNRTVHLDILWKPWWQDCKLSRLLCKANTILPSPRPVKLSVCHTAIHTPAVKFRVRQGMFIPVYILSSQIKD